GQDRGVIAGAAPDVHHVVAGPNRQRVDPRGQRGRLTVVETAGWIDGDGDVVVDVPRIGVLGGAVGRHFVRQDVRAGNLPWTGPEIIFAPHRGERLHQRLGLKVRDDADFFGEEPTVLFGHGRCLSADDPALTGAGVERRGPEPNATPNGAGCE